MKTGPIAKRIVAELESAGEWRRFGQGWLSGSAALGLAIAALLLTLAMRYPAFLTTPEIRAVLLAPWMRTVLQAVLTAAYIFALLSLALRPNKTLGFSAAVLTLGTSILAGLPPSGIVPPDSPVYFGLDFFVLNMVFTGLLFVPFERLVPHTKGQALFRGEWREDLFYYLISSLFVQVLTYLSMTPARAMLELPGIEQVRGFVGGQNVILQFVAIMVLSDLAQYGVHRAFHAVPFLWRFHAVHHSARSMDWLASARMHIIEVVVLRALGAMPLLVLGFDQVAIQAYLLVVYLTSSFVHANVEVSLPWLEKWFVLPRFHHWHHGIEREAIDVNFAIHFPWIDRMFGTYHLPDGRWPSGYGIEGHPVPRGYLAQFWYPFRRQAKAADAPPQPAE